MKRHLSILALGAIALISVTSCDSVPEDERFVEATIVPRRAVLLEDFTGQNCTNCPDGHVAIEQITASLGDSVVPVGIHGGSLAIAAPIGLKNPTGEEYYKAAGQPPQPAGVINMQTAPLQVSAWGSSINRIIMNPTPFTVKAEAKVNGSNFDIDVAFSSGEDYKGKLMVWICENNIIRSQLDHGVLVQDYVHNHVFRAAATEDIWGLPVELEAHKPQYEHFSYPIDMFWDPANIYAVAFLYNDGGVAQVTSTLNH